jgi:hypothetical protein
MGYLLHHKIDLQKQYGIKRATIEQEVQRATHFVLLMVE